MPEGTVELRAVEPDDLPIFFEHQLDPEASKLAAFPSREERTFMKHWGRILNDPNVITRTILYDGQVAGNVVSSVYSEGRREVGYWLGRAFWGRGIATRALAAFLEHDRTRPLYAHVAGHNIASRRVLEKCGFRVVGPGDAVENIDGREIRLLMLKLPAPTEPDDRA